jgi:HD-GYP domain-containing protein (c-di-GMP phosphodiesterase class II)
MAEKAKNVGNQKTFSRVALYVILSGWIFIVIYISLTLESKESDLFLQEFLSTDHNGIRFRALAFFAPLISTVIGYLVNEREKFHSRTVSTAKKLEKLNIDLERNNERIAVLRMIDMAIIGGLGLRETLDFFLNQTVENLGVDAANLMIFNPRLKNLECAIDKGFRTKDIKPASQKIGEGLAGHAALKRQKIVIPNVSRPPKEYHQIDEQAFKNLLMEEEGFKAYFGIPLVGKGNINGVLEVFHRTPFVPSDDWLEFFDSLAIEAAIAIDNAMMFEDLQRSNLELLNAYDSTIEGWSRALDYRDKETEGHSRRVTDMTIHLAKAMGMKDEDLIHVRRGALLHDIGKLGVPDNILLKEGELDENEMGLMKKHPVIAYKLLSPISFLRPAIDIPFCHHEKWDGTGYPRGLKGNEIPLVARIFSVVDVWDALRSDRPYRPAWPDQKAYGFIRSKVGAHFDPHVVKVFLNLEPVQSEAVGPGPAD